MDERLRATRLLAPADAELTVAWLDRAGALLDRVRAGPATLAPRRLYYRAAQAPPINQLTS